MRGLVSLVDTAVIASARCHVVTLSTRVGRTQTVTLLPWARRAMPHTIEVWLS